MVVSLQHNDLKIEVFDDSAFNQTPDSPTSYDKTYQPEKDKEYKPAAQHAIIVYRDNVKFASAVLLAVAGATSVTTDSVIVDGDNLITRCCNTVFSLSLPTLELNWMREADWATCFSIHKYQNTYITHGETSISRIDKNGNILWQYSGADIFVCLYEGNPFEMHDSYIALTDFNGGTYQIDYNGKTISYNESKYHKQKSITVLMKPQKQWWKLWQ